MLFLTVVSYIFYGYWDWRFTLLMLVSTLIDFESGKRIDRSADAGVRRKWLVVSIISNLSLLGFFKYYDFTAENFNYLFSRFSVDPVLPLLHVILPIGISFYTFQSMSYSIDIYRRQARSIDSFVTFAAYVSMFPQLVAGPIVRFTEIESQLRQLSRKLDSEYIKLGIFFFVCGLAKKLLIADNIAARIDPLLAQYQNLGFAGSWVSILGYTLQIYFDFSGYSDMAVGLGYLLGFKLPINFNSPYKAGNISDFWNRWHITLSHWLKDYLYISMGGSRRGRLFTLRNLVLTMFLGGLWHGAAWTFVFWGMYHGVLLVCYHTMAAKGWVSTSAFINRGVTFILVVVSWVFFRSDTFAMAGHILSSMAGFQGIESLEEIRSILGIKLTLFTGFFLFWVWFVPNTWEIKVRDSRIWALALAVIFILCILCLDKESPFLYFQF